MVEDLNVFKNVPVIECRGVIPAEFTALSCDSRQVSPGSLFIALKGSAYDGHQFLQDAAQRGAGAAVVDHFCEPAGLPQILVKDTLQSLPLIATVFYRHPAKKLYLIAVTGSNGKTTTAYMVEDIWKQDHKEIGVIGTIEYRFGTTRIEAPNTTPYPHELQHLLRQIVDAGNRWVVMEVSSHGIALNRIGEMQFDTAIFTNLSQDHLDFHKTMSAYRDAKLRLFTEYLKPTGTAIINADDETGRYYIPKIRGKNIVTFGITEAADVMAKDVDIRLHGNHFTLHLPDGSKERVITKLTGRHNISNFLGAVATAWACRIPSETILKSLSSFTSVPGRLEIVPNNRNALIVVDYCHTPDALEKCLQTLQEIPHNRILTLFGCGGDRDPLKRPIMGSIAARYSDRVIVTSDNPRTENPDAIIRSIEEGMTEHKNKYSVIPDRRQAIQAGIEGLQEHDIFLLAGKGHETYQIIGREKFPFDDREIARDCLEKAGRGEQ